MHSLKMCYKSSMTKDLMIFIIGERVIIILVMLQLEMFLGFLLLLILYLIALSNGICLFIIIYLIDFVKNF